MTSSMDLLASMLVQTASRSGDPHYLLSVLKFVARQEPENLQIKAALEALASSLADAPAYVRIERASKAGRSSRTYEGNIYVEEPNGHLRPATGEDLRRAEDRFPGFVRDWTIDQ